MTVACRTDEDSTDENIGTNPVEPAVASLGNTDPPNKVKSDNWTT